MMNDVLPGKKRARAQAHVGSLYEPLTRFNDSENYNATDESIPSHHCHENVLRNNRTDVPRRDFDRKGKNVA